MSPPGASTGAAAAATMARLAAGEVPWGSVAADHMLVARWTRARGWAAADVVPVAAGLPLHPSAGALHYGLSVFEGMKVVASRGAAGGAAIFRPHYHARRLAASARRLALPDPPAGLVGDVARIAAVARDAGWLPTGRGSALYVRPLLLASEGVLGVRRSDEAMLVITCHPVGPYFGAGVKSLALRVDPEGRCRAWRGGIGAAKTGGSYGGSILPAQEAVEAGFDQVLWTSGDSDRVVGECGQMNFFWVEVDKESRRKTLVTPELDGTILAGATRDSILTIAVSAGIVDAVAERRVPILELTRRIADGQVVEMFGSGTGAIVSPVRSVTVDGETFSTKEVEDPSDVSARLRSAMLDIYHQEAPSEWMYDIDEHDLVPKTVVEVDPELKVLAQMGS